MGDIVDMLTEQMEMDCELYFDNLMYEEEMDSYIPWKPRSILKCRFCGRNPLNWKNIQGRWFLYEIDGNIHNCPNHPLPLHILKELVIKRKKK
jgi:hypothetical protein